MLVIPIDSIKELSGKVVCEGVIYYFRTCKRTGKVFAQRCPTKATQRQIENRKRFALLYAGKKAQITNNK